MADIATDVDGVVAADGAGSGGKRVRGAEDRCRLSVSETPTYGMEDGGHTSAGLAGIAAFPDHGDDRTAQHVCNVISQALSECEVWRVRHTGDKALEEWLAGQIFVVLLEMFLGRRYHLDRDELESEKCLSSCIQRFCVCVFSRTLVSRSVG